MTEPTGTAPPRDAAELHAEFEALWGNPKGWRSLSVVNHTSVAKRFMITGGVFFLIAGLLGMLLRAQLAQPGQGFMGAEAYNQAFTMHGTMMMFLFAVPIQQGLAAYLLPKMLGARDLVFPRLGAFGYWCYLFGGIIFSRAGEKEIASLADIAGKTVPLVPRHKLSLTASWAASVTDERCAI